MSVEDIKEMIAQLNSRQRREIQLYLAKLRSETPDCKRETARWHRELAARDDGSFRNSKRRLSS